MRTFKLEDVEEAMEEYIGFCLNCGCEKESCEPDAREYVCDFCEEPKVYGAAELVVMGLVR